MRQRGLELGPVAGMGGARQVRCHARSGKIQAFDFLAPLPFGRGKLRDRGLPASFFRQLLLRFNILALPTPGHGTQDTLELMGDVETLSAIQKEIRQARPFRSAQHEATIALMRTTDLLIRYISHVVAHEGITIQQYNVLRILRGAGDHGLPTLEIGERMIERTPGVTRLVDRLVAKQLVRRQRCVEDRRQVMCWITETGLATLERLDEPVESASRSSFGDLSENEIRDFNAFLERVRDRIHGLIGE